MKRIKERTDERRKRDMKKGIEEKKNKQRDGGTEKK